MRILHYNPYSDSMVNQYLNMLCESMGLECINEIVTEPADVLKRLHSIHYDILHLYGCWHNSSYKIVSLAFKHNTRLVISPYGQLEPWVVENHYWKEKLPKRLLYQQRIVEKAYAVIVHGKMEEDFIKKQGWNKRVIVVKNALITQSITKEEMTRQVLQVYRKVMSSNQWELMDAEMRDELCQIIKLGITGDERWLEGERPDVPDTLEKWRITLCYAHQEQIEDTMLKAFSILNFNVPDINVQQVDYFIPDGYVTPHSIESVIGVSFASENDRLLATFRHLRKLVTRHQLSIMHLIELDEELRNHSYEEAALCEELKDLRLYKFVARIMGVMEQKTGLTEGMMPMPPLNDRFTRQINKQIENHLKI
ncbi:hypothetical protein SAMN04487851_102164 [Prevotella sp. tc2-28]|uniref:hypothetical protein n=1 Tax=Prevotella sp. tc2-28 TaxID=1761888 RepID=UPI00089D73D4|nr:hypothetical protein [Prevotella sp. tc2-28]SEA06016.1 hypothetical protein SAMN04487851_102164 [Prevotella sp. tc2-28]